MLESHVRCTYEYHCLIAYIYSKTMYFPGQTLFDFFMRPQRSSRSSQSIVKIGKLMFPELSIPWGTVQWYPRLSIVLSLNLQSVYTLAVFRHPWSFIYYVHISPVFVGENACVSYILHIPEELWTQKKLDQTVHIFPKLCIPMYSLHLSIHIQFSSRHCNSTCPLKLPGDAREYY